MDYPQTWTITTSDHTPFPVGPFYLYDDPRLNTPYRVVTFTSPDKTKKFVALTQDFSQAGRFVLNPTIDWAKAMFEKNYPDLSPGTIRGTTNIFQAGILWHQPLMSRYRKAQDTILRHIFVKTIITTRHVYNFGFFTDTENFTTYQNLKERILSSITTNNGG